jgi:hypothetical protein
MESTCRLAVTDTQQRYMKAVDMKWNRYEEMDGSLPEHLMPSKSLDISRRSSRKALSEIFDVLVLSADLALTLCDEVTIHQTTPSSSPLKDNKDPENSSSSKKKSVGSSTQQLKSILDSRLAQPYLLKSENIAEAMTTILDSVRPEKLTRERFIDLVESFMASGKIPPITSYLTSIPKEEERMQRAFEPRGLNEEENPYEKYIQQSKLKSEELARIRYERDVLETIAVNNLSQIDDEASHAQSQEGSHSNNISTPPIEDRLIANRILSTEKRERLAKEIFVDQAKELTFSPNLSASKKSYQTLQKSRRKTMSS